jgi:hypothetical protein
MYSAYDKYRDDPFEDDGEPGEGPEACKYCGADGLYWVEVGFDEWRLHDSHGNPHFCEPNADDFEDISP